MTERVVLNVIETPKESSRQLSIVTIGKVYETPDQVFDPNNLHPVSDKPAWLYERFIATTAAGERFFGVPGESGSPRTHKHRKHGFILLVDASIQSGELQYVRVEPGPIPPIVVGEDWELSETDSPIEKVIGISPKDIEIIETVDTSVAVNSSLSDLENDLVTAGFAATLRDLELQTLDQDV